jgi:putative ABC transport system permease protein
MKNTIFDSFIWKTAWRDSRTERKKLLLFASAIIMGVAALVSVNSFGDNLSREVDNQAKSLLGADIVLESRKPISTRIDSLADSLQVIRSSEISFTSMVLFPKSGGTRLGQVRAISGDYPFYGEFETRPANALSELKRPGGALVDEAMLIQYGIEIGDSIKIGASTLLVKAAILGIPGETAAASLVGPRVYISMKDLDNTRLIQPGSIAQWKSYWLLPSSINTSDVVEIIRPVTRSQQVSIDTVEERRQGVNAVVANVTRFLNIIGYLALLLGALGIASSIHVYSRRKVTTVAILRCLGLRANQAVGVFLIQTMFFGFIGTAIGVVLGISIQLLFPVVMKDFLPVEVDFGLSIDAIFQGLITGLVVTVIFSLLPLLGVRKVSPLSVLRSDTTEEATKKDPATIILVLIASISMILFAIMQTGNIKYGLILSASVAVSTMVLGLVSWSIIRIVRNMNTESWSYILRQGLANLHRPKNQTLILILSLGLGTTLIMTQLVIQHNLLKQVEIVGMEGQPNLILFDVQSDQIEGVKNIIKEQQLPVFFEVPVVTMRLNKIKGRSVESIVRDSTNTIPRWALNREYRSTYRSSLVETEELLKGSITPEWMIDNGAIPISLEEDIAKDLGLTMGDSITIDVQGVLMETVVGSIRKVDWQRVQPNFFIVFPDGPLNDAPQFFVLVSRTESREASANIQRSIVEAYPNVSAVDLELILATAKNILDKAAFVIRFMALFSIGTGLIVLAGSVIISKFQRMRENVLLRTIGASKRHITGILLAEYSFLAFFAALAGLILASGVGWAMAYFVFNGPFSIPVVEFLAGWLGLTALTIIIAYVNSRGTLNKPPLEVLRNEV